MNMHRYLDVTDRVQPRDRSPSASVKRYFHQPQNQPHQHQQHHHESDGKKRQQDQMLQQQQPLLQGQQQLQQTQGQPQGQLLQQLPADEMINMPESVDLLRILQPAKPEIALSSSTNDGGMSVDGACTSRKPNFRPPDRDRICCMAAVLATSHPDRQSSAVAVKPDTIGDVHFENCKACREDCRMVNPVVAAAAATGAPSVLYQCSGSYCTGCQHLEQEDGEDSLYFNYLRYAATAGNGPSSSQNRYIKLGTAQSCTKHPNNISGGSYVKASPNDMSTNSRGGSGSYASTASGRNRRGSELKLAGSGSRNRRRPKWRIGNIWKNLSGSTSAIKAGDVGQSDGLAPSGGDAFLLGAAAAAAPPGKDTLTEKKRCVVKDKGVGRSGRRRRLLFVVACLVAVFIVVAGFLSALIIVTTPTKKNGFLDEKSLRKTKELAKHPTEHVTQPSTYITVVQNFEVPMPDLSGWAFYSRGSSRGSKYTIVNKPMTFYSAQETCQKVGGYLAHVNTLREQLFLEDFLTQELDKLGKLQDDGVGYWIGAKRARGSHEGTCMFDQWKWVDSYGRPLGAVSGLTAFVPGKPDNYYRPEECLFMSYKDHADDTKFLKWDDAPCDLNSVGGIKVLCEVEIR